MRIRYNAPVTLTFALISSLVLVADQVLGAGLIPALFTVPPKQHFSFASFPDWIRLFTHVAGHANWNHLLSNFAFILLLGPILEEKHGSMPLLAMMAITALITGLLNVLFSSAALLGASGIVFMMILIVSFTNFRSGEIPLTFLLIIALYVTKEVINFIKVDTNGIAEFAHIAGGICGSLFGFLKPGKRKQQA
jgi:rhomboid protease GluP